MAFRGPVLHTQCWNALIACHRTASSLASPAFRLQIKKAIEKGNMEGAKIYAQNAIRKKNEQLQYLQLGSRLDAVVSRLDTQSKMQVQILRCTRCCTAEIGVPALPAAAA